MSSVELEGRSSELERVEISRWMRPGSFSQRAYLTSEQVVYERERWFGSVRTVLQAHQVTGVRTNERRSWLLFGLVWLFVSATVAGIALLLGVEQPETWTKVATAVAGGLTLVFAMAYALLKVVTVEVLASNVSVEVPAFGSYSADLKSFARAVSQVATRSNG